MRCDRSYVSTTAAAWRVFSLYPSDNEYVSPPGANCLLSHSRSTADYVSQWPWAYGTRPQHRICKTGSFNLATAPHHHQKRSYVGSAADFPTLETRNAPPKPPQIAPVIIKLIDNGPNFKIMKLDECDAFHLALKDLAGEVIDSEIMDGVDLCAHPSNPTQQRTLLELSDIAGRLVACSPPPITSTTHK